MSDKLKNYIFPLTIISSLYFMWGFVTNLNDILIPHLKRACQLNDFQSAFVQFAFFGAYFFMAVPAGLLLKKTGYKLGMVIGLLTACAGALLFLPSANTRVYIYFLFALSVLASGITILQVAANPYVSILGPAHKAASRISLVGSFNSIGAFIGPFIGGLFILSNSTLSPLQIDMLPLTEKIQYLNTEAASVKLPYVILAACLFLMAVAIYFSGLPEPAETMEEENLIPLKRQSIFHYRHLILGAIAIFAYVGAEVGIGSFIIRYGQTLGLDGFTDKAGSRFVIYYMMSAFVGRVLGIFYLPYVRSSHALILKSALAIVLISLSISGSGYFALWCIVLVGFCNSIMWPSIFPLAIEGLGDMTKKGSSFLIMGIVGGALVPLLVGYLSYAINTQIAFIIPGLCYFFILYYGISGHKRAL
jgi:FHS family L-fucose permease-like MFS transporter